jgi:hypothetical protein
LFIQAVAAVVLGKVAAVQAEDQAEEDQVVNSLVVDLEMQEVMG